MNLLFPTSVYKFFLINFDKSTFKIALTYKLSLMGYLKDYTNGFHLSV